jgi:hypothetical protein
LCSAPNAACQQSHALSESQVQPLNEGGVESTGQAGGLQALAECFALAPEHDVLDFDQAAAPLELFDLAVDEVGGDLPDGLAGVVGSEPVAEVGGQGVEIEAEAIGGEDREGEIRLQAVMEFVDDGISQVESARAEAEDGDDFGGGVEGGP